MPYSFYSYMVGNFHWCKQFLEIGCQSFRRNSRGIDFHAFPMLRPHPLLHMHTWSPNVKKKHLHPQIKITLLLQIASTSWVSQLLCRGRDVWTTVVSYIVEESHLILTIFSLSVYEGGHYHRPHSKKDIGY